MVGLLANGAEQSEAESMTKAELISEYGSLADEQVQQEAEQQGEEAAQEAAATAATPPTTGRRAGASFVPSLVRGHPYRHVRCVGAVEIYVRGAFPP